MLLHHHGEPLEAALHKRLASYDRSAIRRLFAAHRAAQAGCMPTDLDAARFAVGL